MAHTTLSTSWYTLSGNLVQQLIKGSALSAARGTVSRHTARVCEQLVLHQQCCSRLGRATAEHFRTRAAAAQQQSKAAALTHISSRSGGLAWLPALHRPTGQAMLSTVSLPPLLLHVTLSCMLSPSHPCLCILAPTLSSTHSKTPKP